MKAKYSAALMAAAMIVLAFGASAFASKMDDRIESSARKSYVFKTFLKEDDIKIESRDGVVTLTGVVTQDYHKAMAQETLAGLPGVKSVDNRLELKGAAPTANSDAWLRDKVMVTLLFHRSVSAGKTEVDVKDGVVTLRGHAPNRAQRELTEEYAKDVEGVKDVKNEMTISENTKLSRKIVKKIDDASITAQVKMALLLHRSTSALTTTVETKQRVVTVGGKAANAAEKNLVTKLVKDIHGVRKVVNRMIIE